MQKSVKWRALALGLCAFAVSACGTTEDGNSVVDACLTLAKTGLRPIAADREDRFQGKVEEFRARCRGGDNAVGHMGTPWVDWSNYWGVGDATSKSASRDRGLHIFNRNIRGIDGALIDLEYQRMELIKFNLFDNKTFEQYATGLLDDAEPIDGATIRTWPEFRLPPDHPDADKLHVGADGRQLCQGDLIRGRTLTGICNDIRNPAMGATGQLFARNAAFESTFPDLGNDDLARNRHGDRLSLLKPDPQVISRTLFSRDQTAAVNCNAGRGDGGSTDASCPYQPAPFFNVLAAFWIQFMTHDWFNHLEDGRNDATRMLTSLGCATKRSGDTEVALSPAEVQRLGCRPDDRIDGALVADDDTPGTFPLNGRDRLKRTPKTSANTNTAWWDASQIYGFDELSERRVRRDPRDPAKLLMKVVGERPGAGEQQGYLPVFRAACSEGTAADCDPIHPQWEGQEAAAFPDNWSAGLSFLHNVFVREHNLIVDAFRQKAVDQPDADSGLRNPDRPNDVITWSQISDEELYRVVRLIVAAEIAKIHTIEWTTQLLYNEPLYLGMNSNWNGLFEDTPLIANAVERIVTERLADSPDSRDSNLLYSAFAAGPGIVGLGNRRFPTALHKVLGLDRWSLTNPDHVNGGTNHFGSPFNFPEEFVTVYRLHPLVPDLIDLRDWQDPNPIQGKQAVVETFRGKATGAMRQHGLANWALSMGRQRLGLLTLNNHPRFLQDLDLRPRIDSRVDIAALDIIRDREHGVPRFNEFRRQIGLRQLTSFDDFVDRRLPADSPQRLAQQETIDRMREIYGQHRCDDSKVITRAQRMPDGQPITDCLGHADGTLVDNIEDVDVVVGMLAEYTRPHGFAISETQFHIFILNASRRLFSDRFFTSSLRPEFYTTLGIEWIMNNGPTGVQWEEGRPNGHRQQVLPFKRVLLRTMPELEPELRNVVNAFDPWARDRGDYYSLQWQPRPDAASDAAFR